MNPDEAIWDWIKNGRLTNLTACDTVEMWDHMIEELVTAEQRPTC